MEAQGTVEVEKLSGLRDKPLREVQCHGEGGAIRGETKGLWGGWCHQRGHQGGAIKGAMADSEGVSSC